jgi:6-phosphogluconolactonase
MTSPSIIVSNSPEELAERVAADFAALVSETLAGRDRPPHEPAGGRQGCGARFSVALAGGVTPKLFYCRLAKPPYASSIRWSAVWAFFGDERCVPPDHPDSNFGMASRSLLQHVPVVPSHVFRIRGEDPPPQAAEAYEKELRGFFRDSGLWPAFDLILLGMGADGHTASLLPGTSAVLPGPAPDLTEERRRSPEESLVTPRWVVHNVIRSLQTVRITLTLPAINRAKRVWFLVTGLKKAAAFIEAQEGPNPACPASLVEPVSGELRWYVDKQVVQGGRDG